MVRAISCMTVHKDRRIPPVKNVGQNAPHLRRFRFHGIAVEIKKLSVIPHSHSVYRSVLIGSVKRTYFFISVGVEQRADQENDMFQKFGVLFRQHIPCKHQRSLFSFDFPGMDVCLDIYNYPVVAYHPVW